MSLEGHQVNFLLQRWTETAADIFLQTWKAAQLKRRRLLWSVYATAGGKNATNLGGLKDGVQKGLSLCIYVWSY